MRHKNEIPQDKDQWLGHDFVVVNFWPHDRKVPKYDGRTLRPTAVCVNCGVTHWRGRRMGTFGTRKPDGKWSAYVAPSDCGEAYLPYGATPKWYKGSIVKVNLYSCAPTIDGEVLATLARLKAEDQKMAEVARAQEVAAIAYEDQWEKMVNVASELLTPLVPALIKAARSASAKKGAATLRAKVAK